MTCHDQWVLVIVWFVVGVACVVAELLTSTFILIMFAAGAVAAAGAAAVGLSLAVQMLVFAAVSVLALFLVRPVLRRHLHRRPAHMGLATTEGSTAVVLETVDSDHGLVKIDGEMWSARPYQADQTYSVGERVRVIETRGATALVWRD